MNEKPGVPNDAVFQWDVSRMGLPVRPYNALWRSGFTTVGDVYKLNPRELYAIKNLGGKSLQEVIAAMCNLGFVEWADAMGRYNRSRYQDRRRFRG